MRIERSECFLEIKAQDESGFIEGYGSVFGNVDLGGDIVQGGAFGASLKARRDGGKRMPMLWQHDAADPIGYWEDWEEDDHGLRLKGRILAETARGRDALAFARERAIEGLSIGYIAKKTARDQKSGIRTILEADLLEVSLVTFPMNPAATVDAVKFFDNEIKTERDWERMVKEILRDAGQPARLASLLLSKGKEFGAMRDADARKQEAEAIARLAALRDLIKA